MVGPKQEVDIVVAAGEGTLPTSHAVSIGLIVTELLNVQISETSSGKGTTVEITRSTFKSQLPVAA